MQMSKYADVQISFAYLVICISTLPRPRSTMDSIRASEAPDAGSIPAEATI